MANESKYILDLPPVLDAQNRPLSAEAADQSLLEPWRAEIKIDRHDGPRTYVVLCDPNNVDAAAYDRYKLFLNQQYALSAPTSQTKKKRNSKLTHLKDEDEEDDESVTITGEQAIKIAETLPQQRRVFLDLLYPPDWEQNPVVLASNLLEMPKDPGDAKKWLERGGLVATQVIEEIVMIIDPTGPLAGDKRREAQARDLEARMMTAMEEKLQEFQNLNLAPVSNAANLSSTNETAAENGTLPENTGSLSDDAGAGELSDDLSSSVTEQL